MHTLRLGKEFQELNETDPIDGVKIVPNEDKTIWAITIVGPEGSPYEGGTYEIEADFTDNYPFKPPECKFITKMYHPNVKKDTGEICKDIYKEGWVPTSTTRSVINIFTTLLMHPSLDTPLEAEIAKEFSTERETFNKKVKEYIEKYAT